MRSDVRIFLPYGEYLMDAGFYGPPGIADSNLKFIIAGEIRACVLI
jgi:hypothetical protein